MQKLKNKVAVALASIASFMLVFAAPAAAAASTVVVTPDNTQGWVFNGDPDNATPYEFSEEEASAGQGSLYVEPIDNVGAHKFIAALPLGVAATDLESVSYDFLIDGEGTADDAEQYYLNVYTLLPDTSETFYSCRFDYVPDTGSVDDFTTAEFTATDTPTDVRSRNSAVCPDTLAEMPEGSTVSMITLNLGDTSANDAELAGYFDNVVLSIGDDVTTYDFELVDYVDNKDECKNGGWEAGLANGDRFKNQGDCVSYFASKTRNQPALANQAQLRF